MSAMTKNPELLYEVCGLLSRYADRLAGIDDRNDLGHFDIALHTGWVFANGSTSSRFATLADADNALATTRKN